MSGPDQGVQQEQLQNSRAQTDIANKEFAESQKNTKKMEELEAPAISLYKGITSGDPTKQLQAASPVIGQISKGFTASKESIMNSVPPGPARDYALSQLNVQSNAAKSGEIANITSNAFGQLANIGAGLGAFGLQQTGASLNAFGGSASTSNNVQQQKAASKASTMGFLGQLVGGASSVASAGLTN